MLRLLTALFSVAAVRAFYDQAQCTYHLLPCESGQCISWTSWCDGRSDCDDATDELYCRTSDPAHATVANINRCDETLYFKCANSLCIPKAGRCNDIPECKGGEDEENCDYMYEVPDDVPLTTTPPSSTATHSVVKFRGDTAWLPARADVLNKSVRRILESRDSLWGWGNATPQIVIALALADGTYFDPHNHDGIMSKKQLEVQLAVHLMRSGEQPLRISELAQYVQALVAICLDPRDFHGVSVVRLLRRAVHERRAKGLFVSPAAELALCVAGDHMDLRVRRLKNMAYRRSEEPRWLDVQSYALLAISCRASFNATEEWTSLRRDVARNISEWQQPDGSFGSIHTTALALQALIAASEAESARERALNYLLANQEWQSSWGSERDAYYVLPALNMRSLAHLQQRECRKPTEHTQATEGVSFHPSKKRKKLQITIHYSLWIGGDRNEIQTISLRLPKHQDFLEVMAAAEKMNPHFKYDLLRAGRGSSVHSIAGRASDLESSTYWTLYRKVPLPFRPQLSDVTATLARLRLLGAKRWTKDLRKLHPRDGEHLVFWYKPYL